MQEQNSKAVMPTPTPKQIEEFAKEIARTAAHLSKCPPWVNTADPRGVVSLDIERVTSDVIYGIEREDAGLEYEMFANRFDAERRLSELVSKENSATSMMKDTFSLREFKLVNFREVKEIELRGEM